MSSVILAAFEAGVSGFLPSRGVSSERGNLPVPPHLFAASVQPVSCVHETSIKNRGGPKAASLNLSL